MTSSIKAALLLGAGLFLGSGPSWAAPPLGTQAEGEQAEFVPGQVIVKFKSPTALTSRFANTRVSANQELPFGMSLLTLDTPKTLGATDSTAATRQLVAQLRAMPEVEFAHPNYLFQPSAVPNDPLYSRQWHYPAISLPQAWDVTTGSSGVRIAILDTGRTSHPDLSGRWTAGLEYDAADQDGNAEDDGYVTQGFRAYWRHGTHVAGIAGGASNNGQGGAGICWGCQLMPVKVSGASGITFDSLVRGVNWAVNNGARVINMSLETSLACSQQEMAGLRAAITAATNANVTVVSAAGNQAVNAANTSPASCPGVISVAATDRNNALAPYSNFGAVSLAAPGGGGSTQNYEMYGQGIGCPADSDSTFTSSLLGAVSAWTTSPGAGNTHCYRHLSGTSMATPHVAGVVGLMVSVNPSLRPADILRILQSTAQALPGCQGQCGAGLVNAFAAVQAARPPSTAPCAYAPAGQACVLDSLSQYVSPAGAFEETVLAYGRMWKFNLAGQRLSGPVELRQVSRYANGPCTWAPAGQPCRIDSSTAVDYPGVGYVESVSAYGRFWNFDAAGNIWAGSGAELRSVARYASGPCASAPAWSTCTLDSRSIAYLPGFGWVESLSAYGSGWNYDLSGNQVGAAFSLRSIARYANGPCLYAPAGGACTFDTRELANVPGQGLIETLTAHGRYWQFDGAGNPLPGTGMLLRDVARFR